MAPTKDWSARLCADFEVLLYLTGIPNLVLELLLPLLNSLQALSLSRLPPRIFRSPSHLRFLRSTLIPLPFPLLVLFLFPGLQRNRAGLRPSFYPLI